MCVTLVLLSPNACSSCTSLFMKWHIWIIEASGKQGEVINTDCVTCALFTTSSVWCLVLVGVDKEYIHLRVWLITVFVFQVQASLLRGHTWHHHLQSHHVRSNKSGQYECRPTEENSSVIIGCFFNLHCGYQYQPDVCGMCCSWLLPTNENPLYMHDSPSAVSFSSLSHLLLCVYLC